MGRPTRVLIAATGLEADFPGPPEIGDKLIVELLPQRGVQNPECVRPLPTGPRSGSVRRDELQTTCQSCGFTSTARDRPREPRDDGSRACRRALGFRRYPRFWRRVHDGAVDGIVDLVRRHAHFERVGGRFVGIGCLDGRVPHSCDIVRPEVAIPLLDEPVADAIGAWGVSR